MTKKNNTPFGSLFSPELREVTSRLRDVEPELTEIIEADDQDDQTTERGGNHEKENE